MRDEEHASDSAAKKSRQPRKVFAEVGIAISTSLDATCDAISGATGRKVHCDQQYAAVRAWAKISTRDKLMSDPLAERFREFVHEAPVVRDELLLCFRGRFIRRGHSHDAEHMGPPCEEHAPSGRYNKEHEPVLYLCDAAAGVQCELRRRQSDGKLYCQEYLIPSGSMRIVDLAQGESDSLGTQVLEFAEQRTGSGDPAYPLLSQAVAEIVREAEFDGMVVRGAQGQPEQHYRNIVIFDPWLNGRWGDWLAPATEPHTLDPT